MVPSVIYAARSSQSLYYEIGKVKIIPRLRLQSNQRERPTFSKGADLTSVL